MNHVGKKGEEGTQLECPFAPVVKRGLKINQVVNTTSPTPSELPTPPPLRSITAADVCKAARAPSIERRQVHCPAGVRALANHRAHHPGTN
ncbi:hypothetical protein E2C01_093316 [Portunus trituberculatus]|uniref:Uncharacterized protein n=1 Tax=Portunus trituberculatus TaxID=210409 RepID=A0A5B7JT29_PORTR|nr:hypothetical protein [Portunus trituberculatus]